MRFRPFRLINASERAALVDHAGKALGTWWQAWLTQPPTGKRASCGPASDRSDLRVGTDWLSFAAGRGTLHVAGGDTAARSVYSAVASGAPDALAANELPAEALPPEGSVAATLVRTSLHSLVECLIGASAGASDAEPPPELWLRGSGAAWVNLPLPAGDVVVVFDGALVAELTASLPRPVGKSAALANPQQCIGNQPVEVRVWLGHAAIDLATFQSLSVNDVLLLDSHIDRPLRITVAGRQAAPRAVLGCSKQRKAVRLTTWSSNN